MGENRRILHIIWSGTTGGIESQVNQLCRAQTLEASTTPELLICKLEKPEDLMDGFRNAPFPIHFARFTSGMDFRPGKYRFLVRLFRRFDILHMHAYNPVVAWAAKTSQKRIVFTIHGNFGFGRRRRQTEYMIDRLLRRFLNSHADYITFNSGFSRQVSFDRYGLDGTTCSVISNGVLFNELIGEPEPEDDETARCLQGKFVIGVVARFVEVKRIERLLSVFASFLEGRDSALLLVGDGPLRHRYEQLIRDLGIGEHTLLVGFRKNTLYFHRQMHVHVLPSVNEAFGLAAVEALYAGNPVLAYADGGAAARIIQDLDPGDVVPGDEAMEARLAFYYENREALKAGAGKRRDHAKTFSMEHMQAAFNEVYEKIDVRD